MSESASTLQLCGAFGFGVLMGWYTYFVNRYRKGEVQLSDLATVLGVVGGAGVLALFPAKTDLFGAYGLGLAFGFFGYFIVLVLLVWGSAEYDRHWFLDGRRKKLPEGWEIPPEISGTVRPMGNSGGAVHR